MAGKITSNVLQLGDSATASQNFHLKTNVDGTLSLNRGNDGASLGSVLSISSGNETVQRILTFTPQNASGTSIDFTGIPSWAREITVMFNGVSTNGTSLVQLQIGSGSFTTTGYTSSSTESPNGTAPSTVSVVSGFSIDALGSAAYTRTLNFNLSNVSGNTWVASFAGYVASARSLNGGGVVSLAGILDRLRITTVNGTDTFDAGSINILVKG